MIIKFIITIYFSFQFDAKIFITLIFYFTKSIFLTKLVFNCILCAFIKLLASENKHLFTTEFANIAKYLQASLKKFGKIFAQAFYHFSRSSVFITNGIAK